MAVVVSKTNRVAMTVVVRFCGVGCATESTDDGVFSRVKTNHEQRERNQKRVCSSNSKRSPNQWSPMEKKVKVLKVVNHLTILVMMLVKESLMMKVVNKRTNNTKINALFSKSIIIL